MSLEIKTGQVNGRQSVAFGPQCLSRGKLEVSDSIGAANQTQLWYTSSLTTGPGSNGLRMNRAAADNTPLSIGFQQDLGLVWDLGLDATTTDLTLYSNSLANDVLHVGATAGKFQIGPSGHSPGSTDPQVGIWAGTAALPVDGMVIATYGNANQTLKFVRGEASPADQRVRMVWIKASVAGWIMQTDSTKNGTCDWNMVNSATGHQVLGFGTDDSVTLGSTAAATAFKVLSPLAGFFNVTPVAQQANASLAGIGSVTDANAQAALTAIRLALANLGLCAATA